MSAFNLMMGSLSFKEFEFLCDLCAWFIVVNFFIWHLARLWQFESLDRALTLLNWG